MIVCNEKYQDKAGLTNIPQTKDDFQTVKRTINMLNIKEEDTIELIDASHDQIEEAYQKILLEIMPQVMKLSPKTGIGNVLEN